MGLDVGEVGDPEPVGFRRGEVAIDQVIGTVLAGIGLGRHLEGLAPSGSSEPKVPHQSLDGAASDADAL